MNRLNRLHAEQQEVFSSIWGQQLRRRGHQTESSSVLQDRIYSLIEVVAPKRANASPYNSRADTQALPHEATCRPASRSMMFCCEVVLFLPSNTAYNGFLVYLVSILKSQGTSQ